VIFWGYQMSDYLVTEEIKVDPMVGFSAGFAVQDIAVEASGCIKVGDWEG
jgi:hypothetical protein